MIEEARFFFFSSRRRHTRFKSDWSSDVCSSDLTSRLRPSCVGYNVAEVDAQVIDRLRGGDPAAFDQVYRRYTPGLYAFLARLARRAAIAEELLQETWLRLATHARALPADVNLAAWLYTVARNLYRSHRRWRLVDVGRLRI